MTKIICTFIISGFMFIFLSGAMFFMADPYEDLPDERFDQYQFILKLDDWNKADPQKRQKYFETAIISHENLYSNCLLGIIQPQTDEKESKFILDIWCVMNEKKENELPLPEQLKI